MEILLFEIANRRFAIPVDVVRETVRAVAVTGLPPGNPLLEGVVNFRGIPVPLVNLRKCFGLPSTAVLPSHHYIFASSGSRQLALHVDHADRVAEAGDSYLETAGLDLVDTTSIRGIVELEDGPVQIIDIDGLLSRIESQTGGHHEGIEEDAAVPVI